MNIDLESEYLKKLGEGNHDAFDILFTYYHPRLINFLHGFVKDEEVVNDMAQDIFFKVWMNHQTISKIESFKYYLFRMARNMVYDYYDHILIKTKYEAKNKTDHILYTDMIEEEIYARELSLLIDLIIEKMPLQRKKVFIMSRKNGMSNEDIAKELKINKRTVENHITMALSELRRMIKSVLLFLM